MEPRARFRLAAPTRHGPGWAALSTLLIAWLAVGCGAAVDSPTGSGTILAPPSPSASAPDASAPAMPMSLVPATAPPLSGRIVFSEGGDVYRFDLPDGTAVRLTDDPADEFDPDLSPDGTRIAYRMAGGVGDEADIWIMDIDGSEKRNLTNDATLSNWAPAWSPDGGRLCFNSTRDAGHNRIWTMDPEGGDLQLVTLGWGEYCDWSPYGQSIVHAAVSGGTYDIWITGADGSAPRPLTDLPGTEFFPAWSPDGHWIAFAQLEEGVWVVATRPACSRTLTSAITWRIRMLNRISTWLLVVHHGRPTGWLYFRSPLALQPATDDPWSSRRVHRSPPAVSRFRALRHWCTACRGTKIGADCMEAKS